MAPMDWLDAQGTHRTAVVPLVFPRPDSAMTTVPDG